MTGMGTPVSVVVRDAQGNSVARRFSMAPISGTGLQRIGAMALVAESVTTNTPAVLQLLPGAWKLLIQSSDLTVNVYDTNVVVEIWTLLGTPLGNYFSNILVMGPQGPAGPAGTNGIDGTNGATGAQGIQGIQGIQGPGGVVSPLTNNLDAGGFSGTNWNKLTATNGFSSDGITFTFAPTNTPANAQVLTAVGTGGNTKWAPPPASPVDISVVLQNVQFFDDFIERVASFSVWGNVFGFYSDGTATASEVTGETNAPGIWRLSGSTAPGNWTSIVQNNNANLLPYSLRGNWTNEWRFRLASTNNPVSTNNNFWTAIGFGNRVGASFPTSGAFLYYDSNNVNFAYCVATGAGTSTTTNYTTLIPQTNTWYKFRVIVNATSANTNAVFTIDGVQSWTSSNSTNIPTKGNPVGLQAFIVRTDGVGAVLALDLDYCWLGYKLETSR